MFAQKLVAVPHRCGFPAPVCALSAARADLDARRSLWNTLDGVQRVKTLDGVQRVIRAWQQRKPGLRGCQKIAASVRTQGGNLTRHGEFHESDESV